MSINESVLTEMMDNNSLLFSDLVRDSSNLFRLKYIPIMNMLNYLKGKDTQGIDPDIESLVFKMIHVSEVHEGLKDNIFSKPDSIMASLKEGVPAMGHEEVLAKDFELLANITNELIERLDSSSLLVVKEFVGLDISPVEITPDILKRVLKKQARERFMNQRKIELCEMLSI